MSQKDNLLYQVGTDAGINSVTYAMVKHGNNAMVQECGTAALANFTQSNSGLEMVVQSGGLQAMNYAMARHRSSPSMALEGTRGIYALTLSDRADLLEEFKKNSMISSVLMAVVAHSGQAGVVAEGSRALDKLCPTAMCSFRMMGGLNVLLPEVYWRDYTHYEPIDVDTDYSKLMFRDALEM